MSLIIGKAPRAPEVDENTFRDPHLFSVPSVRSFFLLSPYVFSPAIPSYSSSFTLFVFLFKFNLVVIGFLCFTPMFIHESFGHLSSANLFFYPLHPFPPDPPLSTTPCSIPSYYAKPLLAKLLPLTTSVYHVSHAGSRLRLLLFTPLPILRLCSSPAPRVVAPFASPRPPDN